MTNMLKSADIDKRQAFRIEDSLSVIIRKVVDPEASPFQELDQEDLENLSPSDLPSGEMNPQIWKMLVNLNKKIDWIMEKLPVDLLHVKAQPINLSANGMRIQVLNRFQEEEEVRIKILLPTFPISELVIDAKVARVTPLEGGRYDLALAFKDLEEEVREELIQYSLKQQRKILLAQREQKGKNESQSE
jgi:hypothetical protein